MKKVLLALCMAFSVKAIDLDDYKAEDDAPVLYNIKPNVFTLHKHDSCPNRDVGKRIMFYVPVMTKEELKFSYNGDDYVLQPNVPVLLYVHLLNHLINNVRRLSLSACALDDRLVLPRGFVYAHNDGSYDSPNPFVKDALKCFIENANVNKEKENNMQCVGTPREWIEMYNKEPNKQV